MGSALVVVVAVLVFVVVVGWVEVVEGRRGAVVVVCDTEEVHAEIATIRTNPTTPLIGALCQGTPHAQDSGAVSLVVRHTYNDPTPSDHPRRRLPCNAHPPTSTSKMVPTARGGYPLGRE